MGLTVEIIKPDGTIRASKNITSDTDLLTAYRGQDEASSDTIRFTTTISNTGNVDGFLDADIRIGSNKIILASGALLRAGESLVDIIAEFNVFNVTPVQRTVNEVAALKDAINGNTMATDVKSFQLDVVAAKADIQIDDLLYNRLVI